MNIKNCITSKKPQCTCRGAFYCHYMPYSTYKEFEKLPVDIKLVIVRLSNEGPKGIEDGVV
jgi:hypothetical protein